MILKDRKIIVVSESLFLVNLIFSVKLAKKDILTKGYFALDKYKISDIMYL